MKLVFDTETTGFCDFRAPAESPRQPQVVQLAALLAEDDGTERAGISVMIRPEGFEIPAEAAAVHGITTELALRCGVPLVSALSVFNWLCEQADTLIAHNIEYDRLVLRAAYHRLGRPHRMAGRREYCTMKAATDICRIPGGGRGWKYPKLTEAHRHFFGVDVEGAHDAMNDVRACWRVYRELQKPAERTVKEELL